MSTKADDDSLLPDRPTRPGAVSRLASWTTAHRSRVLLAAVLQILGPQTLRMPDWIGRRIGRISIEVEIPA
jgi:hypothetical protein